MRERPRRLATARRIRSTEAANGAFRARVFPLRARSCRQDDGSKARVRDGGTARALSRATGGRRFGLAFGRQVLVQTTLRLAWTARARHVWPFPSRPRHHGGGRPLADEARVDL